MSVNSIIDSEVVDIHGSLSLVLKGDDGESAYEVAVRNGFVGTEEEWLNSLKGEADRAEAATAEALVWRNSAKDYAIEAGNHEEAAKGYRNECQTIKDSIAPQVTQAITAIQAEKAEAETKKALVDEAAAQAHLDRVQADADAAEVRYLHGETVEQKNIATDAAERARRYAAREFKWEDLNERPTMRDGFPILDVPKVDGTDATGTWDIDITGDAKTVNGHTVAKNVPANAVFTDTTYSEATTSQAGLLSASDKAKLNGIESGAQANTITGVKGGAESSYRVGNVNITKANIGLGNVDNTADNEKSVAYAANAGTVNNHAVDADVPSNAKFTDTKYSAMSANEATTGTATTARTITAKVLADYVAACIANLVNSAPATLDTLKELADALGDDPNFATTMTNALAEKLGKNETAKNAEKVNNLTVQTAVPANAKFTDTTYSNFVKSGSGAKAGLVPAPSTTAGTKKYLREDGNWVVPPNTTYSVATTSTNGLMSKTDKATLDAIPNSYATQAEVNQLATTATNSVSAAVSAKNDAVAAKNQAQQIADGLVSIRDTAVDTSLAISGQAADSKTVGDKFDVIGATSATNNEYLVVWLDSANRVLFGVKADGSFYWQKGIPKVLKDELDGIKARLSALEG